MEKLRDLISAHKVTAILIVALFLLGAGGLVAFQKFTAKPAGPVEEVDLIFDPAGPYALLYPRRDGNALILDIRRVASYNEFAYQLSYTDGEGIDRGAGFLDTWIKLPEGKGNYEQELLFGSCSKNVCKYDEGVENGTLILRLKKGQQIYRTTALWHLQKPDVALGILTSGDGHLVYKMSAEREQLSNIGFTIVNDLTGVPKLPSGKLVYGKVYSLNAPIAKNVPSGDVSLELAENPPSGAKLFRYNNEWTELETKVEGAKLSAKADGAGIFAVLVPRK